MAWNSKGLRGSTLEELVNLTNERYRDKGLAIIQKIPTPITPVRLDENRNISFAYFDQKSTVDYIGAAQGLPVCFDAKGTGQASLPIQNIHAHQIEFMKDFEDQRGFAFLLVYFNRHDEYFLLPFVVLRKYWAEAQNGGRKSIPYKNFDKRLQVFNRDGYFIHYLEAINTFFAILDEDF
ncbi:MAG: Holliday junction resolvase RecU [Defluviitaleaceae bacterium]|nr:Holliday junction resolvase RecU [Defluviitaleaceae bacterium]